MANKKFNAFLSGLLLGSLTGAVVGIILAPQSGEDTRDVIRDRGLEFRNKAASTVDETRVRAEEALQRTRERSEELGQRGQDILTEQRHRIEHFIDNVKQSKLEKLAVSNGEEEALPEAA